MKLNAGHKTFPSQQRRMHELQILPVSGVPSTTGLFGKFERLLRCLIFQVPKIAILVQAQSQERQISFMRFHARLLTWMLLVFTAPIVHAQVVRFNPSFATANDSLTVTLHAEEGNAGLRNFTGEVYLHAGLITGSSTSGSDWKFVPFGWETNNARMQATRIADNRWEFKFLPTVREFFGVSDPNLEIRQVAIVYKGVRNGQIVAQGKDTGNRDIFIDLSQDGANARLLQPTTDFLSTLTRTSLDIVGIGAVTTGTLTLQLLVNGQLLTSTSDDTLRYSYTPEIPDGVLKFDLVATNGQTLSDTASFTLVVRASDGQILPRPDGLRDGITYTSSGSVRLSLFAPKKSFVYVLGDFNEWTARPEFLMHKEPGPNDSTWFWLDIAGLTPGQQYGMQYLVDGTIRIADPYSELILDEFNDVFIPESVFPNLKPYPTGKTNHAVTLLQPGEPKYEFQVTEWDKPRNEELVIYELLIRDFVHDHSFQTIRDTLDYLQNLGVNAIEFMPVSEFDGNISWGYNPSFHYALDKYYGTPAAFKRLVDEIHRRNMLVFVDMVFNHATGQNPLVRLYNSGGTSAPTPDNPFFFTEGQHDLNVFNDMNHYYPGSEYYVKRVVEHWLTEYRVDGFRFDLSKGFSQAGRDWNPYNAGRIALWKRYADHMWSVNPHTYVMLEHYGVSEEEHELSNYGEQGMMFWVGASVNHNYAEATMGYHENGKSDLSLALPQSKGFNTRRNLITYFENHDEQWLMFKNRRFGNKSGTYDIKDFGVALDRMKLAGVFFFPLEGPKLFWQFGELGYGYGDNGEQCLNDSPDCPQIAPGRTDPKPIRWDYRTDPGRNALYQTWSALIRLRRSSSVFTDPDESFYALRGPVKYYRLRGDGTDVVAIGNFGVTETTEIVDFTQNGTWHEFFSKQTLEVDGGTASISLSPGAYRLYTTRPFDDIVVSAPDPDPATPLTLALSQNFPNPFNPTTQIAFALPRQSRVKLSVFDVTGRVVTVLLDENRPAGNHQINWNASRNASGVYFLRMEADGKMLTRKMTLLK